MAKGFLKDPRAHRLHRAGTASELRPFMVFAVMAWLYFLEKSLSAALSKTSIFMPNKGHTMCLESVCISPFQNLLVVEGMPSPSVRPAVEALRSLDTEAFPH